MHFTTIKTNAMSREEINERINNKIFQRHKCKVVQKYVDQLNVIQTLYEEKKICSFS